MNGEPAFSRINLAIVSRAVKNGNAVKIAAYNSGTRLQHAGKRYDFRHKTERIEGCILLPEGSPDSLLEPGNLARAIEVSEKRVDAQLCRQILITLPRELAAEHRLNALKAVAAPWVRQGMGCQIDLHCPIASDGEEQPHGHLLVTLREVRPEGLSKTKNRTWNQEFRADDGKKMRAEIDARLNGFFSATGLGLRVDNRSREAQGLPRNLPSEPQVRPKDWAQWLREGAKPEAAPIMIKAVISHRENRAAYEIAIATAEAAEVEVRQLEIEIAALEKAEAWSIGHLPPRRNKQKELALPAWRKVAPGKPKQEELNIRKPQQTKRPDINRAPHEEAWMRGAGGYEALSDANQKRAKASWDKWAKKFPELAARHPIEDYVSYVQDRNPKREAEDADDENPDRDAVSKAPETNSISPASLADADAQRRAHLETILAERYRTPAALSAHIQRIEIDRESGAAILYSQHGKIVDKGNTIEHPRGAISPELAMATVAAAAGKGWSGLTLTGSYQYKEAIARAAALHEPPIQCDHTLSRETLTDIADQIMRRNVNAVAPTSISPGASQAEIAEAYLGHAERVVRAKLKGRPVGSTDADELSSPRISEAIERRQQVLTDAREANEAAAAHRQEHGWASRLLDGSARRRQTALDSQAARLDKAARRIDRRHDGVVRRIEKNSEKLARNNQRATEDWRWTPAVRKALADQEILTKARVGLAFGDPATVEALSRKDFRTAAQAAETAQERADPRGMALRRLSAAEKTVESDPVALAQARWATAAAIAGDEQTITAVNAGDPAATTQAAAEYQRRKRGDEIRQRQAREAAMALGQPIEQGLRL